MSVWLSGGKQLLQSRGTSERSVGAEAVRVPSNKFLLQRESSGIKAEAGTNISSVQGKIEERLRRETAASGLDFGQDSEFFDRTRNGLLQMPDRESRDEGTRGR
jgi:hypothetical protein